VIFLRNLGHDLVDKRLWPVALVLVIALIAVPVVLGRSSAPAAPATVPPAPAGSAVAASGAGAAGSVLPGQAVVSLQQPLTGGVRYRRGPVRNPFVQHHLAKVDSVPSTLVASASPTAGAAGSPVRSSGGSGSAGSSPASTPASDPFAGSPSGSPVPGSSPAPSSGTKPTAPKGSQGTDANDVYRVSLRFGEAGDQRTIRDVARLTPLPSSSDPFFVFLGVLKDGKTAVFLVSSDATATGDGSCKPRATNCETIQLKAGDTEFFDLSTGTAGVIQYQLDLLSVGKRDAASTAVAAKRRARESKAGRDILRAAVKQTDLGFDYIPRLGVLKPAAHDNVKDDGHGYVPASVLQGSLPGVDPVTEEPAPDAAPAAPEVDASGYMPAQPVPADPPPAAPAP
jgi:hypothetical protein